MLVKFKTEKTYYGYVTPSKNDKYIVYAIESPGRLGRGAEYYVLRANCSDEEDDPTKELNLWSFPAEDLEILEDKVSSSWVKKVFVEKQRSTTVMSFPEWFEDDFYVKAHDFDMDEMQYDVVKKYKKLYEKIYIEQLNSHKN